MTQPTGMPVIDASDDFARARRAALVARMVRWLSRRHDSGAPRTLDHDGWPPCGTPQLRVVPLAEIVGTVEPTNSFDADFRPSTELVRARWEQIALAHHRGVALPPIDVLQQADGYYIIDGHHRVSVARTLGDRNIAAHVTCSREDRRFGLTAAAEKRPAAGGNSQRAGPSP
jgi:hypothetical protein